MALGNMDNKKQIIIIIFAIAAGIIASALVGKYVASKVTEETTKLGDEYVARQMKAQQVHDEQMAALNQRIQAVQASATQAAEDAAKAAMTRSAQATQEVVKKKPSLAVRTPVGKRAITIQIESLRAIGGLLNPGDFVDIIAHLDTPTGKKEAPKEKVTAMIFQNVQVLAVNTNLDDVGQYDDQQKATLLKVTVAVDPQEAGLLAFAEQNGKLELALRMPTEKDHRMLPAANWQTLAEYVLENGGADIKPYDAQAAEEEAERKADIKVETENVDAAKPYIQIYRGGREL